MKRTAFLLAIPLLATTMTASAGTIEVTLAGNDGSKSPNTCGIVNDYNFKEACTDANSVAQVDVADADRKIQIYVKGTAAACARAGDSITIIVKDCGIAGFSLCPETEIKCQ